MWSTIAWTLWGLGGATLVFSIAVYFLKNDVTTSWLIDFYAWVLNALAQFSFLFVDASRFTHALNSVWLITDLLLAWNAWNNYRKRKGKKPVHKLIGEKSRQLLAAVVEVAGRLAEGVRPPLPQGA